MLEIVERAYVPELRKHIVLKLSGTPTTNVRFLWAPQGNIYGSELTPANVDFNRLKFRTPIDNLFFTGASAEFPSVGATVVGGSRLYTYLTGDPVNPGRDTYGLL
jgi:phytoene dehydrogenase-like protein